MLVVQVGAGTLSHRSLGALGDFVREGDALVVNDAATLPASLPARCEAHPPMELRLAAASEDPAVWQAVLFGAGDWRSRTEERPAPPALEPGSVIRVAASLEATVIEVSPLSPRLLTLRFSGGSGLFWREVYAHGRPVQYAHLRDELPLWHAQTRYAGRPWAAELPSAGYALRWSELDALRAAGVVIARVTHAAGLSATGDERLDEALPLPERYEVPEGTALAIERAKSLGRKVIAVGTSVVRALEGCALAHGSVRAARGITDLRVGEATARRVVDGVLSGVHDPGTSHFELLTAFAPRALLLDATREAESRGYLGHEYGDLCLVLAA